MYSETIVLLNSSLNFFKLKKSAYCILPTDCTILQHRSGILALLCPLCYICDYSVKYAHAANTIVEALFECALKP